MSDHAIDTESVTSCIACGGNTRTLLFTDLEDVLFGAPGRWSLWRCSCDVIYLDPRPTPVSVKEAYRSYYTHEGEADESSSTAPLPVGHVAYAKLLLRNGYLRGKFGYPLAPALSLARWLVPALFPRHRVAFDTTVRHLRLPGPNARLLDVGCGDGRFLLEARALGWNVLGQEVDGEAADRAANRGVEVIRAPLKDAHLPDSVFDAVTVNHVLEHVHQPRAMLEEIFRVLRPGGVLWVATPNARSPLLRLLGRSWRGLEPPRHLHLLTAEALRSMMENAGFENVRWRQATPLTRWMNSASAARARPGMVRALELASLLWTGWSEQLVATGRKRMGEP